MSTPAVPAAADVPVQVASSSSFSPLTYHGTRVVPASPASDEKPAPTPEAAVAETGPVYDGHADGGPSMKKVLTDLDKLKQRAHPRSVANAVHDPIRAAFACNNNFKTAKEAYEYSMKLDEDARKCAVPDDRAKLLFKASEAFMTFALSLMATQQ